jgi:predicted secreted protein
VRGVSPAFEVGLTRCYNFREPAKARAKVNAKPLRNAAFDVHHTLARSMSTAIQRHFIRALEVALAALVVTLTVHTNAMPQPIASSPENIAHLSASATIDVTKDVLTVVFSTTKEGADSQFVQAGLKQALDAALAEAKKIAKPGQVEVQTGGFSLYPRYTAKGAINGWVGSTELVVSGKDVQAVAQLTSRVQSMTIARVGQDLSREAREKVEGEASEKAIARFRVRAGELAKQFGFASYTLREVHVTLNEPAQHAPMVQMRSAEASAMALPVEPGKGSVTAMVNGSIQMK